MIYIKNIINRIFRNNKTFGDNAFYNVNKVGLKNVAGTQINPATEDKQDTLIANQTNGSQKSQSVDSSGVNIDFATETTLNAIDTNLTEINSVITPKATLLAVDSGDSTIKYIGKAYPGSLTSAEAWMIQRMTKTTDLVLEFADGDSNFDNVWDDRESLSYS